MTDIASICVFCGSRGGDAPDYRVAAEELAQAVVAQGVGLVYGGGDIGLMGALAGAVLAAGGRVTGVIPDFLMKYEIGDPGVTELVVVKSMHERKRRMFELADGFVVLPGGLGTLDEMIEVVTWKQLQQHAKPVVVVDVAGYWRPLVALLDSVIAAGFAHPAARELFTVVERVDQVFPALAAAPMPRAEVLLSHL